LFKANAFIGFAGQCGAHIFGFLTGTPGPFRFRREFGLLRVQARFRIARQRVSRGLGLKFKTLRLFPREAGPFGFRFQLGLLRLEPRVGFLLQRLARGLGFLLKPRGFFQLTGHSRRGDLAADLATPKLNNVVVVAEVTLFDHHLAGLEFNRL